MHQAAKVQLHRFQTSRCHTSLLLQWICFFVFALTSTAQTNGAKEFRFPCPENEIASYTAYRVEEPIFIDGKLDEKVWDIAQPSPRFIDILTGNRAVHDTRAFLLWDDVNLYIAYKIEEPFVQAKYTNRNDPIYYDNDVEFFIAGRDAYYEFEINAFNTVYEVFFIWERAYEKGGFSVQPEFTRSKLVPFNGVGMTNHPLGGRLGHFDWSYPGKKTAVAISGTINNHTDRDRGWTVELAFPWKGLASLARAENRPLPPVNGDVWRMNFSRFNTYKEAQPANDSGGWVWTRHGIWDSHIPECFAKIRFSTKNVRHLTQKPSDPLSAEIGRWTAKMPGSARAESQPGVGSWFWIEL